MTNVFSSTQSSSLSLTRLGLAHLVLLILLLSVHVITEVRGQQTAVISGMVFDENNTPLQNVLIGVLGPERLRKRLTTDSEGRFHLAVTTQGWYRIYAVYNRTNTPGVDYVPSTSGSFYLQLGSTTSFTFILKKGASLYIDGDVRFAESSKPVSNYGIAVIPLHASLSDDPSLVRENEWDLVRMFDFNRRLVVIPADTEVVVEVSAEIGEVAHTFTIKEKVGYFKLPQGETLHVDIREHALNFNVANLKQMLDSTFSLLKNAEDVGFLVTVERQDLLNAYGLIDASILSLKKGLYDESFAKLRYAYILNSRTVDYLQGLTQISAQAASLLPFLFVFIASASAYLVTQRENSVQMLVRGRKKLSFSLNLIIAVVFYAVLFSSFYFLYPGCRLASQTMLLANAVLALILGQTAVVGLPRAFPERRSERRSIQFRSALIAAFSMACRNLRRRKLRTTLTLANLIVLIFGFVTFTSISPGYGLLKQPLRPAIAVDALLIRDIPLGGDIFLSLPSSLVTWLESQANATLVSPKAENIPTGVYPPLGYLYTESGERLSVQGVVGIIPSVEVEFTRINDTIIDGDYLQDGDVYGTLTSASLRETLNVGDTVYGFEKQFIIKGFFDPSALEKLLDVDGEKFIPQNLEEGQVFPCDADHVIITVFDTALTLPKVAISRVNVQLGNPDPEGYSDFAQMVTLSMDYKVYVSHPNSLHLQYVGDYIEERGAGLIPILMILVILNVSASTLGTVEERRSEITSLSSVGLNPAHIAALFMAEAAVIGFVGGGLGYLLGILGYRLASNPVFGTLLVREKASTEWGLIALVLSGFTSILASVIPALKASTIVTPSHLRKWRVKESEKPREKDQPWLIELPIKLMPRELEPFIRFMLNRLSEESSGTAQYVTDIRLEEQVTDEGLLKRLSFRYNPEPMPRSKLWSKNELVIKREGDYYDVELLCIPSKNFEDLVYKTGVYARKLIFEWNAKIFEIATPFDPSLTQLYTLVNAYAPTTLYIITTEPNVGEKLEPLNRRLVIDGLRPPKIVISRVNGLDIEQCMNIAEELVSRADVVCISGEPDAVCTSLAINAATQKKTICSIIDPRPMKVRLKDPFRNLKIVELGKG